MKSFTLAAALLASVAIAQPHGHQHERRGKQHAHEHDKRALVVEIDTAWVTATVIIGDDSTQTILPSIPSHTGGEFFEPSSTSVPVVAPTTLIPQVAPAPSPSTQAPPPPPAPEPTTAPEETTTAAPVVVPTVVVPPVVVPSIVAPPPVVIPTSVAAPQPPPVSGGGSSGGGSSGGNSATETGDITYYDVGQGACGYDDSAVNDTGFIAAISADFWNSISPLTNSGVNSPTNPLCDKKVTLSANGKTVDVTVRDKCPGCPKTGIDVSKAAFKALFGDLGVGRSQVTWSLSW